VDDVIFSQNTQKKILMYLSYLAHEYFAVCSLKKRYFRRIFSFFSIIDWQWL